MTAPSLATSYLDAFLQHLAYLNYQTYSLKVLKMLGKTPMFKS